ncbi:MAG: pyridoxal-phosphate dependent enzyme [Vicinamibacterales bacterium]
MLTFTDIEAAAARLKGVAHRTPVITSRTLNELVGATVYLKAENLQRMGAFKFRGGYNAVNTLTEAQRARGVVAFSSGNHAQAVALAAKLHGCAATIVMPLDAPASKLAATRGYGAEVVTYDRYTEDRATVALSIVESRGAALIPPFDHYAVMAGQGTAALELIQDVTEPLDAVIVCTGGGGFVSGCAVAAQHLTPAVQVFASEPQRGNDIEQSLRAGKIVTIPVPRTICDGQQTQAPGVLTFEIMRQRLAGVLTVPDPVVVQMMRFLFERLKLVVEPSGASALASLLHHRDRFAGKRVGVTLSGGNVSAERFAALMSGAEAAG